MDIGFVHGDIRTISTALGLAPTGLHPIGWAFAVNGIDILIAHQSGNKYRYYGPHWIIAGLLSDIDGINLIPVSTTNNTHE